MKRLSLLFVVAVITSLVVTAFAVPPVSGNQSSNMVRVLVQFNPGSKSAVAQALRGYGAEIHYEFDSLQAFAVTLPSAALDGIRRNPYVALVEEDAPRYLIGMAESPLQLSTLSSLSALASQTVPYGIDMVQARDVWDADRDGAVDAGAPTGAGRKICIIDSGLYTGHEDFDGVDITGGYPSNWNQDGFGHGTHVAGTIAAMNNALGVVGVTPGTVSLYIVRVFGDDGAWAYASTLIDAANRCASTGANIISMSLGGGAKSRVEERGFNSLYNQGILSIAAAGNDGSTAYSYPASYNSVVSVAAIDSSQVVADFSQKNSQVELAAPGVGVLSTVPYLEQNTVTVDGFAYSANHIEFSARGSASGVLVDGGLCDSVGVWSGKVVLCERGGISFYDKVMNAQTGGAVAAVIYNNAPGNFLGTLGDGNSSAIIALSLSQEDGQYLVASKLGSTADVVSSVTKPGNGYEAWDGTSMATPHVSAVAALIWSAKPTATNVDIRNVMTSTAFDLGAAGRDTSYGFGLVQAKAALDALVGGGSGGGSMHVSSMTGVSSSVSSKFWQATVTITVMDQGGAPVSNATVVGQFSGGYSGSASCVTNTSGVCSVTTGRIRSNKTSVTFAVTDITHSELTYNPGANAISQLTISMP